MHTNVDQGLYGRQRRRERVDCVVGSERKSGTRDDRSAGFIEQDQLASLKLPIGVKVRGVLGTEYHAGGTEENPSALVGGWILYMDVHEVEALKIDYGPKPQPGVEALT